MRLTAALNFVSFLALVRLASTGHVYELTSQPGAVPRCDPTGSTNADSDGSAVDCLEHQPDTGDGGGTLKLVLVILVAILTAFAIVCACFLRHRYTTMVQYHKIREQDFDVDNCLEMDELEGSSLT